MKTNASAASPVEERSKGEPLRAFEDEKFWELCPIDSIIFETLKVQHANINLEDLETDHEDLMKLHQADDIPCEVVDTISHDSNAMETDGGDAADDDKEDEEEDGKEETSRV
ncbi:hypothetical protein TSUD_353640 [Trifolium subterraneum]|uniref:Uncharacterized protein n=1 Tax=Trifolium subterraneum TaxID=3900 RepID=A0A2Z6NIS1_TRISU|nr:hypothetical protein TSUD_353640 [Trifolium subterraneum]